MKQVGSNNVSPHNLGNRCSHDAWHPSLVEVGSQCCPSMPPTTCGTVSAWLRGPACPIACAISWTVCTPPTWHITHWHCIEISTQIMGSARHNSLKYGTAVHHKPGITHICTTMPSPPMGTTWHHSRRHSNARWWHCALAKVYVINQWGRGSHKLTSLSAQLLLDSLRRDKRNGLSPWLVLW